VHLNPSRTFAFLLEDTIRLYAQRFERRAEVLGLTLAQCKVLVHLVDHEGISQMRLAELTDFDPTALARALDSLECRGWLERSHDPADRRANRLFLQARSKPLVDDIREAFAGIPMRQAELMIELLERIKGNLASAEAVPLAVAGVHSGRTSAARRRRERASSQR
jgi:MarR family transcriptional regulator for hemolysin